MYPTPLGLNVAPANRWSPCPTLNQVLVAGIDAGAGKLTLGVPLDTGVHNWTLTASPDVTQVRVPNADPSLNISIKGSGTFTFDAAGVPGHSVQIALTTATPEQTVVQLVRTDWLDAFNAGETFTPDFIDKVSGASVLRFMDWCRTNPADPSTGEQITAWTPETAQTYNVVAVPVEIIAKLCNQVGADCWFNIPSTVTMTEARRVVEQLRSLLLPWLKLHVEWSNEVWNTAKDYKTGRYAVTQPGGWTVYYGTNAAALAQALEGIQGVDLALCGKWGSPKQMQAVITAYKAAGGPWGFVGGLGFAPYPYNDKHPVSYFLPDNHDGLLAEMDANRALRANLFPQWVALGKANDKPVWRYEEALSPFPKTDAEKAFAVDALKLPRAGQIMRALWADADAAGCGFGCFYTSAAQGVFGFAPDYASDGYPQRAAWAGYNKRAWPMSRAMGRGG